MQSESIVGDHCDQINLDALSEFLKFGITYPGTSLRRSFAPKPVVAPIEISQYIIDETQAAKVILEALYKAIDDLVSRGEIKSFAMSGGTDTRLILAILHRNHRSFLSRLPIYTRIHPQLTVDSDRDGIVAKALANRFGLKVEFESSDFYPKAYLYNRNHLRQPCLSGLWGGELLGGQLFTILPFSISDIYSCPHSARLKNLLLDWKTAPNMESNHLQVYFNLIIQSGLSALYETWTWLHSPTNSKAIVAPFTSESFLSTLFTIDPRLIKDYRLYAHLLKNEFPEYVEVAVNNHALEWHGLNVARSGTEAKSIPDAQVTPPDQSNYDPFQRQLAKHLENRPPERFSRYLRAVLHMV